MDTGQWKEFGGRSTSGRQKQLPGVHRNTQWIGWEGTLRIIYFQPSCPKQGHHKLTKSSNIWGNEQAQVRQSKGWEEASVSPCHPL